MFSSKFAVKTNPKSNIRNGVAILNTVENKQ